MVFTVSSFVNTLFMIPHIISFRSYLLLLSLFLYAFCSCKSSNEQTTGLSHEKIRILTDSISSIAASAPGEVGVALIVNNIDTIAINNKAIYPMMSVFKLHQAIALCKYFDGQGLSLDSVVSIERASLNPDTWSPMMKDHTEKIITLPVKELLKYTLIQSDNNASNVMFNSVANKEYTDSLVADIIPRSSFQIKNTEEEMSENHENAYSNFTSPLGAAMLINTLFTDSLMSNPNQQFLKKALTECATGKDRIVAPLEGKEGVVVAHKTGSGYINKDGKLVAHNDVAFISLPDGTKYSLAVFVKDFDGDEIEAAKPIARISAAVYSILSEK